VGLPVGGPAGREIGVQAFRAISRVFGSSNDVGFLDIDPKWSSVETLSEVATLPMG